MPAAPMRGRTLPIGVRAPLGAVNRVTTDAMTITKPPTPRPMATVGITVRARGIPPARVNNVEAVSSSV